MVEVTFFSNGEFVVHQVEDQDVGFDNEGIVQGATFRGEGLVDIAFMAPGGLGDGCIVFGAVHGLTQAQATLAKDASGFNHLVYARARADDRIRVSFMKIVYIA